MNAGPGNYYATIDSTKSCSNFKTQLFNLISKNITLIPYAAVDNNFNKTDYKLAESGGGYVIVDRYSSENPNGIDSCNFRYPSGYCGGLSGIPTVQCQCYDKEHVFPSSWFGGTDMYPYYTDTHFIWPADRMSNFKKGNLPLGYVSSATYTSYNGTKIGTSNATLNNGFKGIYVFEPADAFKGDFARAYLYFVTRFEDSIPSLRFRSIADSVLDGNKYPGLDPWILKLCVKWSKQDPPSAFEKQRNDSVFAIQGNRNPYIDYPHWVEKAFGIDGSGVCLATAIRNNKSLEFSIYPNPTNNLINIQITKNIATDKDAIFEIVDIVGQKITQQNILLDRDVIPIDVSYLAKGTYILNVIYKGENNANTFIVQ